MKQKFVQPRLLRSESACSLEDPMRSAPMPVQSTPYGRLVKERSSNGVPDLLSEDEVDEDLERFLILPKNFTKTSPSSRPKRCLSNDCHDEHACTTDGSPTNRRRTQEHNEETSEHGIDEEIVQWLRENTGWDHCEEGEHMVLLQEKAMLQTGEANATPRESQPPLSNKIPPMLALRRQNRIVPGTVPPQYLKQEALLLSPSDQDGKHHLGASSTDGDVKSRVETPGQVELYPGKQVKIHSKDRAYASLRNGNATIFQCIGCSKRLLANQGTKLLYCAECGTLTPTEIKGEVKDSDIFSQEG